MESVNNKKFVTPTKEYKKKWLSYEEQYTHLSQRGMSFDNYPIEKAQKSSNLLDTTDYQVILMHSGSLRLKIISLKALNLKT